MLRLVLVWVVAVLCGRGFVFDADENNALWPSHFVVVDVLIGRAPWRSRAEERDVFMSILYIICGDSSKGQVNRSY